MLFLLLMAYDVQFVQQTNADLSMFDRCTAAYTYLQRSTGGGGYLALKRSHIQHNSYTLVRNLWT